MAFSGIPVRVSEHAVIPYVHAVLVRNPIKKRRKQWTVHVDTIYKPACFIRPGGGIIIHPTLFEALRLKHQKEST